jgi:hypothetical protein
MRKNDYKEGDKVLLLPDSIRVSESDGCSSREAAEKNNYKSENFRKVKDIQRYKHVLLRKAIGVIAEVDFNRFISIDGEIHFFCVVLFKDEMVTLHHDWLCTYSLTPVVKEIEQNEITPLQF